MVAGKKKDTLNGSSVERWYVWVPSEPKPNSQSRQKAIVKHSTACLLLLTAGLFARYRSPESPLHRKWADSCKRPLAFQQSPFYSQISAEACLPATTGEGKPATHLGSG